MDKYDYVTKTMQIMDFEHNTKHAHEDYMYVQEDRLVTRQEAFDDLKEYFEDGNKILSSKLLFEDEDLLAWKEVVRGSDGKKYRVTNVQIWRDGKAWREMVSHVEVPEDEHLGEV